LKERTLINANVLDVLLEAIGASINEKKDDRILDDEEESDDDVVGASKDSGDEWVFLKASDLLDDPECMDVDPSEGKTGEEEDSDIQSLVIWMQLPLNGIPKWGPRMSAWRHRRDPVKLWPLCCLS
jgi:hypothetical protein